MIMEIKTIFSRDGYTIVEWIEDGLRRRGKLPFQTNKTITEDMLSLILPYGMVWGDVVYPFIHPPEIVSEEIDKNFYNNGIFTQSDLQKANPNQVLGLLLKSYGIDYNIFMKTVDNYLEAR